MGVKLLSVLTFKTSKKLIKFHMVRSLSKCYQNLKMKYQFSFELLCSKIPSSKNHDSQKTLESSYQKIGARIAFAFLGFARCRVSNRRLQSNAAYEATATKAKEMFDKMNLFDNLYC